LRIFDVTLNTSREVLTIAGESLGGGRFALDDSKLFFLRSVVEGDIWCVSATSDVERRAR
jgi:hypothetical protein